LRIATEDRLELNSVDEFASSMHHLSFNYVLERMMPLMVELVEQRDVQTFRAIFYVS
jgi:hypothetical protein